MTTRDPIFLTLDEVLTLHAASMQSFGGLEGVRNSDLLISALGQPQATFADEYLHRSVFEMAAAYLFHIARNHPFIDGNKRTGYACAVVFLWLNGLKLVASQDEAYQLVIDTATGKLDKTHIAEFFRLRTLLSN